VFTPENLDAVVVSFEGPDPYSMAGGLGVRATEMCRALVAKGFKTHLVFIGDPGLPREQDDEGVNLVRCLGDLAARTPGGVYDGEAEKVAAFTSEMPSHVLSNIVEPALAGGRRLVIICEDWQTADFCIALHLLLLAANLRDRVILLWNANNWFRFGEMDWTELQAAGAITTVSRYMKQLMRPYGAEAVVIPNGIPENALRPANRSAVTKLRKAAKTDCLAFKMARLSSDKGWSQALGAISLLRAEGTPARLFMRGGIEGYGGGGVIEHARSLGLSVFDWIEPISSVTDACKALSRSDDAAVINLGRFVPLDILPEIEVAATAVLANSIHEPFGLVGLEAMAAGAVAIVGATGEEYARSYANAIAIETEDPAEVASALHGLVLRPDLAHRLRLAARHDAAEFTWSKVIDGWLERLRFLGAQQNVHIPEQVPA
jgi:glycosyltransferase involved in cell wall biosynthesis